MKKKYVLLVILCLICNTSVVAHAKHIYLTRPLKYNVIFYASLKKLAKQSTTDTSNQKVLADTSGKVKSILASANTDTLHASKKNSKGKRIKGPKQKSARQLRREAFLNDPANFSEKKIAKMGFRDFYLDSADRDVKRPSISFIEARPYPLHEPVATNIKFYHRYWRDIDLLNTKNQCIHDHHAELISALLSAVKSKQIKAFSPVAMPQNPYGDAFTVPIAFNDFMAGLSDTATINIIDQDGNITGTKQEINPFTPEKICGYRIKEDVFYDKIRARTITRIVGIAPLVKLTLSRGDTLDVQPLCWIKFTDCRKILVTINIDPTKKVGDSMDDIFLQHRFYSQIIKESNPDGQRIKDYKTDNASQLEEAHRIEKKIANFKKDIWDYTMQSSPDSLAAYNTKFLQSRRKAKAKTITNSP